MFFLNAGTGISSWDPTASLLLTSSAHFVLWVWNVQFLNGATIFSFKFLVSIMFLILIRGGTPRYRYDYLTKLGWLKFIGLTIISLVVTLILLINV